MDNERNALDRLKPGDLSMESREAVVFHVLTSAASSAVGDDMSKWRVIIKAWAEPSKMLEGVEKALWFVNTNIIMVN